MNPAILALGAIRSGDLADTTSSQPSSVLKRTRGCLVCGRAFTLNPCHAKEHRYCSPRCRAQHYRQDKQRVIPGQSRVERAFSAWIQSESGQAVEGHVVRYARMLRGRGVKHYGIAGIWERIRWDFTLTRGDEPFKLNNSFRSLMVRRVVERLPELAGFFETRPLRGRA